MECWSTCTFWPTVTWTEWINYGQNFWVWKSAEVHEPVFFLVRKWRCLSLELAGSKKTTKKTTTQDCDRPECQTWGFKTVIHKPVDDVTAVLHFVCVFPPKKNIAEINKTKPTTVTSLWIWYKTVFRLQIMKSSKVYTLMHLATVCCAMHLSAHGLVKGAEGVNVEKLMDSKCQITWWALTQSHWSTSRHFSRPHMAQRCVQWFGCVRALKGVKVSLKLRCWVRTTDQHPSPILTDTLWSRWAAGQWEWHIVHI